MSGHNAGNELAEALLGHDPGNGGVISVQKFGQLFEMVSTESGGETRTLLAPTRPGMQCVLRQKTDGGDIVVTAAEGLNVAGNTAATFADVGDQLVLVAVSATTGYRWEILVNTGSVSLA